MPLSALRRLWRRVKYRGFDRDLREELASHQSMTEEALRNEGVSASEARRRSIRALGNLTLERENSRSVWIPALVDYFVQDVRYAGRGLMRQPGFTIAAALTLATGIGLVAGFYALFNGLYMRGWNLPDPERLVAAQLARATVGNGLTNNGFTLAEYRHIATSSRSADYVVSSVDYVRLGASGTQAGDHTEVLFTSDNFLQALQVPLRQGTGVLGSLAAPTVVISDRTWRRTFDEDPNVIGRTAWVNRQPATIVGVMAPEFDALGPRPVQAIVALRHAPALSAMSSSARVKDDAACCLSVAGRLRGDMTVAQAEQELQLLMTQWRQDTSMPAVRIRLTDTSPAASMSTARARTALLALSWIGIACGMVWLLSCANVGNLYLARSLRRRSEIAMRLALGATRRRVVRQLLTEGVALAMLSGVGALLVTFSVPFLFNLADDNTPTSLFPTDWRVVTIVAVAVAISSVVVSLAPALQITRTPWRGTRAAADRHTNRLRAVLLAAQIAVATTLVLAATLLTRAIGEAANPDVDYALQTTSTISVEASGSLPADARQLLIRQTVTALASASDLSLGLTNTVPSSGFNSLRNVVSEPGSNSTVEANLIPMSEPAFRLLELPLVRGRFASSDPAAAEAVVNESLARLMWPGDHGLGRSLRVHFDNRVYRAVGVVRDSHIASLDSVRPLVHIAPSADLPSPMFVGRTVPGLEERVRAIVAAVSPRVLARVAPLTDSMRQVIENAAVSAAIAGSLGAVALLLAVFGVFTVFAYTVEERRREVGIRLALGASGRQIRTAMFSAMRGAIVGGLAVGLVLAALSGFLLRAYLFGLSPLDPLSYVAVALLLLGSAVVATAIPIRRALRLNPAVVLKGD